MRIDILGSGLMGVASSGIIFARAGGRNGSYVTIVYLDETDMTTEGSPLYEFDSEGCYVFVRKVTRKEILDRARQTCSTM